MRSRPFERPRTVSGGMTGEEFCEISVTPVEAMVSRVDVRLPKMSTQNSRGRTNPEMKHAVQ